MNARISQIYADAALMFAISIGREKGLFDQLAVGPLSATELAERCDIGLRYAEEWLGAVVCGGLVEYEVLHRVYTLSPVFESYLRSDSDQCMTAQSALIARYGSVLDSLCLAMTEKRGLDYSAYGHDFHQLLTDIWDPVYRKYLVDGFLHQSPTLIDGLKKGIAVTEIGCGEGSALMLLADQFPCSSFCGIDISRSAISKAQNRAQGRTNLTFLLRDAREPLDIECDLILAFDTIHDLPEPQSVLKNIHNALRDSGHFVMVEFDFSSKLENNIGNPFAVLYYTFSLMHCVPVSLAQCGPGLGAVWGIENAQEALERANFSQIEYYRSPRPQNCIFICTK